MPDPEVLVLALDRRQAGARLRDWLVGAGVRPVVAEAQSAVELPDPARVRAAIIAGSDDFEAAAEADAVTASVDWLLRADAVGTPVMAIGQGARLLAVALGGRVVPAARPFRGWVMIDTSVPHLIPTGPWLTSQRDLIWLPSPAQVLAHNRLGPQVFRLGRHLGVHFHPEATPSIAAAWAGPAEAPSERDPRRDEVVRDHAAAASSGRRLLATFLAGIQPTGSPCIARR